MINPENPAGFKQARVLSLLSRLVHSPPTSLILEGGPENERRALARHLQKMLHCSGPGDEPCLECIPCLQIEAGVFRDLFWLEPSDGLSVDSIREMRPALAQNPSHGWRMVVIAGAHDLNLFCANALLKAVEEPVSRNLFVFLAGQREHLPPTLVSRSFVLTLDRPPHIVLDQKSESLYEALLGFISSGRGFLDKISHKNVLNPDQARQLVVRLQLELARGMRGDLNLFQGHRPVSWYRMNLVLHTALKALDCNVRIHVVLQWLALTFWGINRTEN